MDYRLDTKKPHLIRLILLISFPSVAVVLIAPALPALSESFQVSQSQIQQLITIFLIGYAVGQLTYSPFANRFGRKTALYWGLGIYVASCLVCLTGLYLHMLHLVLLGRFLMAIGSASGLVLVYTIINDFYHPHQARSVVSYAVLAYAFMPSVAVLIGGLLTNYLSTNACFYFLLLYALVIYFAIVGLPETLKNPDPDALKTKRILSSYLRALSSKRLILFSITFSFVGCYVYISATGAPFILINQLGISPSLYGVLFLLPYSGQLLGSVIAGRLNRSFSAYQMMWLAYFFLSLGCVLMLIFFLFHWINVVSFLAPLFLIMLSIPLLTSNASVMALSESEDKASSSAIMTCLMMTVTLLGVLLYTLLPNQYVIVMPITFIGLLLLTLIAFWITKSQFQDEKPS